MSQPGSLPRLLLAGLATLWIEGCATQSATDAPGTAFDRATVCRDGAGENNRQAPIVCVDDSARTLSVAPEPIVMHDVLASDRTTPVAVHWFTRSGGGDLRIDIERGCVGRVQCDGRGHCFARTLPGARKQCKYDVWIRGDKHDRLDPTLVVDPCCS